MAVEGNGSVRKVSQASRWDKQEETIHGGVS